MAHSLSAYHGFVPGASDGRKHWYYMKETLKSAGWTVRCSGDGLSAYGSSSDIITHAGSGANGISNNLAWYVIYKTCSYTGQRREFCVQMMAASHTTHRLSDSASAGFVTGSPSATRIPDASDEIIIFGGGTSAAPTGTAWLDGSTARTHHYIADNNSVGWYMHGSYTTGDTLPISGFVGLDPIYTHAADGDKYIYLRLQGGTTMGTRVGAVNITYGIQGRGGAGAFTGSMRNPTATASGLAAQGSVTDPVVNKHALYNYIIGRIASDSATTGSFKGVSRFSLQSAYNIPGGNAINRPITLNVESSKDYISLAGLVFPWDGTAHHNEYANNDAEYLGPVATTTYTPVDPTPVEPPPQRTAKAVAAKTPTLKKVGRILPGKKDEKVTVRDVTVAVEPIRQLANQLADSPMLGAKLIQGVTMDDGAEVVIAHGLGRKPLTVVPCNIVGADAAEAGGRIDRIPDQNDHLRVIMRAIGHGATIKADFIIL